MVALLVGLAVVVDRSFSTLGSGAFCFTLLVGIRSYNFAYCRHIIHWDISFIAT